MERIKINLPEHFIYREFFSIENADINEAEHMGNERILIFANGARQRFFKFIKFPELDLENNCGSIIANHSIVYKAEGFLGDKIECEVGFTNCTNYSFDLVLHFIKNGFTTMAIVRTGIVYFDYKKKEVIEMPEIIKIFYPENA
ncbi:MAG TPA: thioesterase family protein [Chitinophagales bacterium]|nr:thioesterase family protein [Chitinophagales bacterium]HNL85357.1 thioesterase family protein [Chitinophagales bacterium]